MFGAWRRSCEAPGALAPTHAHGGAFSRSRRWTAVPGNVSPDRVSQERLHARGQGGRVRTPFRVHVRTPFCVRTRDPHRKCLEQAGFHGAGWSWCVRGMRPVAQCRLQQYQSTAWRSHSGFARCTTVNHRCTIGLPSVYQRSTIKEKLQFHWRWQRKPIQKRFVIG